MNRIQLKETVHQNWTKEGLKIIDNHRRKLYDDNDYNWINGCLFIWHSEVQREVNERGKKNINGSLRYNIPSNDIAPIINSQLKLFKND